jgi:hypothetical protein
MDIDEGARAMGGRQGARAGTLPRCKKWSITAEAAPLLQFQPWDLGKCRILWCIAAKDGIRELPGVAECISTRQLLANQKGEWLMVFRALMFDS